MTPTAATAGRSINCSSCWLASSKFESSKLLVDVSTVQPSAPAASHTQHAALPRPNGVVLAMSASPCANPTRPTRSCQAREDTDYGEGGIGALRIGVGNNLMGTRP